MEKVVESRRYAEIRVLRLSRQWVLSLWVGSSWGFPIKNDRSAGPSRWPPAWGTRTFTSHRKAMVEAETYLSGLNDGKRRIIDV